MRRRFAAAALVAVVLAVLLGASVRPAAASRHLLVGLYDDGQTLYNGDTAFPVYEQLRVQVLRMQLHWGGPGGVAVRRPAEAGDPADPAYDWTLYDRAVRRAAEYGIKVVFSIWGTPRWENGGAGYNVAPRSASDLEAFAAAAANRYSGVYSTKAGVLPAVKRWLAWNEPNNPVFLKPQFLRAGRAVRYKAAEDYARICTAVYAGVHATMNAGEQVGCGVTAPRGNDAPGSVRPSTSPLAFLRAVHRAGLRRFDVWAHHPYNGSKLERPTSPPPRNVHGGSPTSITLGNIGKLVDELTRLYGPKHLWITEYGYQTDPPDPIFGVPWATQASYLTQAFAIARRNPRIDMMIWYLLQDEPSLGGFQSGLRTTAGRNKPAFTAYERLPH